MGALWTVANARTVFLHGPRPAGAKETVMSTFSARIDVHHHLIPPAFVAAMAARGLTKVAGASVDLHFMMGRGDLDGSSCASSETEEAGSPT